MPSNLESYGFEKLRDDHTGAEWELVGDPQGLPGKLKGTVGLRIYTDAGDWLYDRVIYDDFGQTTATLIGRATTKDKAVEQLTDWVRRSASQQESEFF